MHSSLPFQAARCSALVPPCRGGQGLVKMWRPAAGRQNLQTSTAPLRACFWQPWQQMSMLAWQLWTGHRMVSRHPPAGPQHCTKPAAFSLTAVQLVGQQLSDAAFELHTSCNQNSFAGRLDDSLRERPQLPLPIHSSWRPQPQQQADSPCTPK